MTVSDCPPSLSLTVSHDCPSLSPIRVQGLRSPAGSAYSTSSGLVHTPRYSYLGLSVLKPVSLKSIHTQTCQLNLTICTSKGLQQPQPARGHVQVILSRRQCFSQVNSPNTRFSQVNSPNARASQVNSHTNLSTYFYNLC